MTNSNQKQRFQTKIALLEQELADTRKALDCAIIELKNVVEDDDFDIYMRQLSAQTTLEQIESIIKAKEQQ